MGREAEEEGRWGGGEGQEGDGRWERRLGGVDEERGGLAEGGDEGRGDEKRGRQVVQFSKAIEKKNLTDSDSPYSLRMNE